MGFGGLISGISGGFGDLLGGAGDVFSSVVPSFGKGVAKGAAKAVKDEVAGETFGIGNDILSAGVITTGALITGLLQQEAANDASEKALAQQQAQIDEQNKLALAAEERLREDQLRKERLELELAAIQARAQAGSAQLSTSGIESGISNLQQGSRTEQQAIGNLIQGTLGALG